ncbi:C40 family peptidase [Streptomyces sp. NRRL WC-3742]|uniref:C40 family peptidase n=1 Tax=Streptomyces sp. NRRL WC-3742 TaxID=1463934 RepID=UPI0004C9134C|nr:C40 family peptidase [Streptomyces sp. NRRL WC-3742]
MPVHRRSRLLARALVLTAAATTAIGVTPGGSAQAAPGSPDAPSRKDVKSQVEQLYDEAEQASEKYNAALEAQKRLQGETTILQGEIATAQDELNDLRGDLAAVAGAEYRGGGMARTAQLMLSSDPEGYLSRARTLDQAATRQQETLHEVVTRQRRLDQRRAEAAGKLEALEQTRRTLADSKQDIQQRLAKAQKLLNSLSASERARMTAQDARDAEQRATRGTDRLDLGDAPAASERGAAALAAAVRMIGSPYVYGSTGPRAFDCSGLMYYSWRQAGVTLPRTSQAQAYAGQRISLSEARPGDLVIFYRDMHHVGMYAGGGVIVHAPYPGARVRYESVNAMPVSGVVRL